VGAGVVGDGGEFWTHPAKRIQSMSMRKMRGRKAFFMARDLYHYLFTSLSFFSKAQKNGKGIRVVQRELFF
jgi:hypothetical protein